MHIKCSGYIRLMKICKRVCGSCTFRHRLNKFACLKRRCIDQLIAISEDNRLVQCHCYLSCKQLFLFIRRQEFFASLQTIDSLDFVIIMRGYKCCFRELGY